MSIFLWRLAWRRAWLISTLGTLVALVGVWVLGGVVYAFASVMLAVGGVLSFAFLTALPSGTPRQRAAAELVYVLLAALILGIGFGWGWLSSPADYTTNAGAFPFLMVLASTSYAVVRVFARPYAVWKAMRQRRLRWAIAHAQLRLVIVAMGVVLTMLLLNVAGRDVGGDYPLGMTVNNNVALLISFIGLFGIMTGAALVLVILPAGIIAALTARHITRRLDELVSATRRVRDGDESVRVAVSGEDEIAALQADFNQMLDQLGAARRALEDERDTVRKLLHTRQKLFADVSHELRTPISTIRAHLDGSSNAADYRIIQREVLRLQRLVDEAFTFARADVHQLPYHIKPLEIGAVLEQTVQTVQKQAWQAQRVEVTLDYQPQLPLVMADDERVRQVLYNLLRNAVRHTPPGGLIRVVAIPNDTVVQISVRDTGGGIPPDDLPLVWERYHHAPDSDGAGLGLALVKEMVQAMGGTVGVVSTLGQGSCFSFTLPRVR
ncbi:MAG: HAMP domain-containing histidine kinase [Anaerolineae bacterium]|nr:HAMP domain-containing histidine kinase [Anaerolineae bacterium]